MRLLMLNPNTSQSVTDLIAAAARAAAAPGTEVVPMTAPRGVPYIANRAEAVIGGAVALEMLAASHATVDAAVIAAFADPALGGARELFPIPVIGLAEAGMLTACMLGARFAIVTFVANSTTSFVQTNSTISFNLTPLRAAACRPLHLRHAFVSTTQDACRSGAPKRRSCHCGMVGWDGGPRTRAASRC